MSSFHGADDGRASPRLVRDKGRRLPVGQAVLVIAGLSALCWAILIAIVMVAWSAL